MPRILSIDGGGIRGIIPAAVLVEIERMTGTPVARLFDVIAGTSTGGILACGLGAPDDHGDPRYAASDLLSMYIEDGATIFPQHLFERITALYEERYPCTGIERVLRERIGESMLSESVTELLVTAYDLERRKPRFFRTRDARADPTRDHPLWMVARSTSAAPPYFEPFKLPGATPLDYEALVDGGVFANNPAMCAYVDGSTGPGQVDPGDMLVVSLGTGSQNRPILYDRARTWGQLQWARPVLDVVFEGVSATTDYQLAQILGDARYFRIETELTIASDDLDRADAANIATLREQAAELIAASRATLERVCAVLVEEQAETARRRVSLKR